MVIDAVATGKWEYALIILPHGLKAEEIDSKLNELGKDRWDLVAMENSVFQFKRPVLVDPCNECLMVNDIPSLPSENYPLGFDVRVFESGNYYRNIDGAWVRMKHGKGWRLVPFDTPDPVEVQSPPPPPPPPTLWARIRSFLNL